MSTLDVRPGPATPEREKSDKIAQVAARGARVAAETGQDPEQVAVFLTHYFRHVDAEDVEERSVADLLGLVESHYRQALRRPAETSVLSVRTPVQADDGWTAGGATVVQIVTDDRPFLVDSVTMEVLRQGWSIREVFHPQFIARRDPTGALRSIVRTKDAERDPTALRESWMHLEVLPPAQAGADRDARLEQGLREVLQLVTEAVDDWAAMHTKAAETVFGLEHSRPPVPAAEIASAKELLAWLSENHFTFLGYREYAITTDPAAAADGRLGWTMTPVPGTGLGVLSDEQGAHQTFNAIPAADATPSLMIITKDDHRSRVHRPAYLDYIGIRTFGPLGQVVGERRFLGLFASSAYSEAVTRVPVLRSKAAEVVTRSGWALDSHGGKAIMDVLDTYPRDELFQTSIDELAPIVEHVAQLKERRQVRMFVRRDHYGRYLSCLVYLPRDRYTTAVRNRMEQILLRSLGGESIDYTARVSESVLARLHFVVRMPVGESMGEPDVRALERELTLATRSWNDEFADEVTTLGSGEQLSTLVGALPEGYKEDYSARQAIKDLAALEQLEGSELQMAVFRPDHPDDEADLRLKIFRRQESLSLSTVLPHLTLLGVDVIDERPYELTLNATDRAFIYDFGLKVAGGHEAVERDWDATARDRFTAAFAASYLGESEPDRFNALVMLAGMPWRQVSVLRAVGRYLRQAGTPYSQTYIAAALAANVGIAQQLVELFVARFDPDLDGSPATRTEQAEVLTAGILEALDDVPSLDHDRIIRSFLAVVNAVVRTNYFQSSNGKASGGALTFKLLPKHIPDLPEPRPAFEIFVYSPRVEGVHLRFGAVARGGLRWSDRAEDFRTEVLGLVKAQMVKNTVIVPVGAKGGFFGKRLPDPTVDRDAWLAEGIACYQLFIESLLDVTDNIVVQDGTRVVVPPPDVVRYDDDDPYLVVAADKGTATFSDIANRISVQAGFWLGDAFASGGSAGYDHKAMGITARGAWESVLRHFRELGVDCQTTDFSCVGVGDMSGDVFGNGMLLSHHTKLVAAFDHRHVFVDPTPDPEVSWAERARMFALPRSSWADYDPALISAGGGVFPRTLKSIPISEHMRTALGIAADVTALAPTDLITAILTAPVDLLWNGGIGTYVKARSETNASVGDKANDVLRVDGADLRARCVGEGGNLGLTQRGRIEYAAAGGRINTDFIDNSAGVDTSDHEVNIKILLEAELTAGRLDRPARDELLHAMTDEVADHVLVNNYDQNLALANSELQAPSMAGVHEDWMARLVEHGLLDRGIEALPGSDEMAARRHDHRGLTAPELATLLAYTKIVLEREVLASDLPDDPYLHDRLITYFPTLLRKRYAAQMAEHRLHREIITTVAVNDFVNQSGITCFHRLSGETGARPAEVLRAQIVSRNVFEAERLDNEIRALDHVVDAEIQTELRMEVRTLVERASRWMINNRRRPIDVDGATHYFADGIALLLQRMPDLLRGREADVFRSRRDRYTSAGVPTVLAATIAVLPPAYAGLTVVQTAVRDRLDVLAVAEVHFDLSERLGLDRLLAKIVDLPRDDRWQTMARAAVRDDLHAVHAQLTAEVLEAPQEEADATTSTTREPGQHTAAQLVSAWEDRNPTLRESVAMLSSICDGPPDLARMSVGLRLVRALLPAAD